MAGLKKRSLVLAGHGTSLALEPEFWAVLEALAAARSLSLAALIAAIDAGRGPAPSPPPAASQRWPSLASAPDRFPNGSAWRLKSSRRGLHDWGCGGRFAQVVAADEDGGGDESRDDQQAEAAPIQGIKVCSSCAWASPRSGSSVSGSAMDRRLNSKRLGRL